VRGARESLAYMALTSPQRTTKPASEEMLAGILKAHDVVNLFRPENEARS
jgi:hypothetical protein